MRYPTISLTKGNGAVFTANLPESFEAYADYQKAYLEKAQQYAESNIKKYNSAMLGDGPEENGWAMGNSTWPYNISGSSSHSGFGTGAFTSIMFWDYYDYTRDLDVLQETTYPAVSGMSKFLSRIVKEDENGYLLAQNSHSPEVQVSNGSGGTTSYSTEGCAFDQQMIYENHLDSIKAAQILEENGITLSKTDREAIARFEEQLPLLDPVQVGASGQVKEFREEEYYGDIGTEMTHRHTSQLVGVYPGTMINNSTPAWQDAAKVSMTYRDGTPDLTKGWSKAHRMAIWARLQEGDQAYKHYNKLLKVNAMYNLFNDHGGSSKSSSKTFQADANYGAVAGVSEMLLQSHDGYIAPLAGLPTVWSDGSYSGLLARENFEVSAKWTNGQATEFQIVSGSGGECSVKYANLSNATVVDETGVPVDFTSDGNDLITFDTQEGKTYTISDIPSQQKITAPEELNAEFNDYDTVALNWTASEDADSYRVYFAKDSAADYTLVASDLKDTTYTIQSEEIASMAQGTFCVVAVSADGHESKRTTALLRQVPAPDSAVGQVVGENTIQFNISQVNEAETYRIYRQDGDTYTLLAESPYYTIVLDDVSADASYYACTYDVRESVMVPVELTTSSTVENVMLNKPISTPTPDRMYSSYPLELAVDGDSSTRFATTKASAAGTPFVVEIDLQSDFLLDDLTIHEFLSSSDKVTRSDQTTIELWDGTSWITVVDKQPLDYASKGTITHFDMQGQSASKVRITFVNNTGVDGQTIYEIACIGSTEDPVNKLAMYQALMDSQSVDTSNASEDNLNWLNSARKTAEELLYSTAASQASVDEAAQELRSAVDLFLYFDPSMDGASAYGVGDGVIQFSIGSIKNADSYRVYEKLEDGSYQLLEESEYNNIVLSNVLTDKEYAMSVVVDEKESPKLPAKVVTDYTQENLLLKKPISTPTPERMYSSYPLELAVDGIDRDKSSRFAVTKASTTGVPFEVEIDLEGNYYLDDLMISEFLNSSETTTRSDQTTIEVWNGEEWMTVVDKQPLDWVKSGAQTHFDMQGVFGSKIKITFVNNSTLDAQTIYEITCSGAASKPENKLELYQLLKEANQIDISQSPEEAVGLFQNAKKSAEAVLSQLTADKETIDKAVTDLQAAMEALKDPVEEANKFNLEFYLSKAQAAIEDGTVATLVESAQNKFNAAVSNAKAILADDTATQAEVDAAAVELRTVLNMLSMVAGNKDALIDLIAEAKDLIANADGNYPQSAIDALQNAIDAAQSVADDGDAFQADVDKAVNDLQDAIEVFQNSKLDWRALKAAVADAANVAADKANYVDDTDAWEAFDDAYAAAQNMLESKTAADQAAIDEVATALLEASSNLRYKADKDTLKAVIGDAENVDVTLYTASSVAMFRSALAAANTVLADESLSVDDQVVVDNATATLEEAMLALVPIDQATADGGDNTIGGTNTGTTDTAVAGGREDTTTPAGSTKTGDGNPLPIALAVIALAGAAGFVFRKKVN